MPITESGRISDVVNRGSGLWPATLGTPSLGKRTRNWILFRTGACGYNHGKRVLGLGRGEHECKIWTYSITSSACNNNDDAIVRPSR
jgi:hypothetical protein